jgi:phosphate butyryltransferase
MEMKAMKSIQEIKAKAKQTSTARKIAVAMAQDEEVLLAIKGAKEEGLCDAILIGNKTEMNAIASKIALDLAQFELIDESEPSEAARIAVSLVRRGEAHIVMKGMIATASFLKAVLDKECGLRKNGVLSHVAVFETIYLNRLLLVSDCAMNIAPDLNAKAAMLNNLLPVTQALGIIEPKVAVIGAVETVNQDMPATVDAASLAMMYQRGQIKGMVVDGPLAFDNAISLESARHKGIKSEVAGRADVIIVPDIEAGNVLYKTLVFFSQAKNAGIIMGAAAPVILTSRCDSAEAKINSIALGIVVSESMRERAKLSRSIV